MADQSSPVSPFFTSPKFIYSRKLSDDSEPVDSSPVSVLETKNSHNPFARSLPKSSPPSKQPIGLALIFSLIEDDDDNGNLSKPVTRMALLGSKLKIQIPAANPPPPLSPKSLAEFGTKTRSSQFPNSFPRSRDLNLIRNLSLKEMEISEDYTCVITHGPNPKTTHIFDECIVDNDHRTPPSPSERSSSSSFVSLCDEDAAYICRGEKALCCEEHCRFQEMIRFEGINQEP